MTAGGWTPEFPGQRPPFEHGNGAAVVHGAFSARTTGPLAEKIAADLLADNDSPDHLREPVFGSAVMAWAQAEAVCRQLRTFLESQSVEDALTELTTIEEDEERDKVSTRRRSTARRVAAALDASRKWEAHAANLRSRLGLDPASAARVGRDVAARRYFDSASPLGAALDQIEANRQQALTAGNGHGDSGG